jgi:hypothetical protein
MKADQGALEPLLSALLSFSEIISPFHLHAKRKHGALHLSLSTVQMLS